DQVQALEQQLREAGPVNPAASGEAERLQAELVDARSQVERLTGQWQSLTRERDSLAVNARELQQANRTLPQQLARSLADHAETQEWAQKLEETNRDLTQRDTKLAENARALATVQAAHDVLQTEKAALTATLAQTRERLSALEARQGAT